MPTYEILNWDETFENSRSRQVKDLQWLPIPNRFDGSRVSELIEQGGPEAYAAWCAFALVCSRSPVRGQSLKSNQQPHTLHSLARITGLPKTCFEKMLALAVLPEIALIQEITQSDTSPTPERQPPDTQPTQDRQPSAEGRKERKERKHSPQPPSRGAESESVSNIISLPSLSQWHAYAKDKPGYHPAELAKLYHHYNALGWVIKGKTITYWQSLVDAKLEDLAPAAPKPQPTLLPEPADWQDQMRQLYPNADPAKHTWSELCKNHPDIAAKFA